MKVKLLVSLVLTVGLLSGCSALNPDDWLSTAEAPVIIEALSFDAVLLRDARGNCRTISNEYYMGMALIKSKKVGDRIK
jgi:hypothetical protein